MERTLTDILQVVPPPPSGLAKQESFKEINYILWKGYCKKSTSNQKERQFSCPKNKISWSLVCFIIVFHHLNIFMCLTLIPIPLLSAPLIDSGSRQSHQSHLSPFLCKLDPQTCPRLPPFEPSPFFDPTKPYPCCQQCRRKENGGKGVQGCWALHMTIGGSASALLTCHMRFKVLWNKWVSRLHWCVCEWLLTCHIRFKVSLNKWVSRLGRMIAGLLPFWSELTLGWLMFGPISLSCLGK